MGFRKSLSILLVCLVGCTTSIADSIKAISLRYEEVVTEDGISLEEAETIAQKQIIKGGMVELYNLNSPRVDKNVTELPHYQDYWFIYFDEKRPSSIPLVFMSVINKETGNIKFAGSYDSGKPWILEAALLR